MSLCVQIVYVAPMKALAAEMTNYFSKRLEPLGVTVKELTGDMQLSKGEILRTQVSSAKMKCMAFALRFQFFTLALCILPIELVLQFMIKMSYRLIQPST